MPSGRIARIVPLMEAYQTLDLDGDDDDLVREVEQAFGIRFSWGELRGCHTVGDLEAALLRHYPASEERGACASQMAFYRLRRWMRDQSGAPLDIRPATRLEGLLNFSQKACLKAIKRDLGFSATGQFSRLGCGLFLLAAVGLVGWAVVTRQAWPLSAILLAAFMLPLVDRGEWGSMTVGDLARKVATANQGLLAEAGADRRRETIWRTLREIVGQAAERAPEPDRIARETTLCSRAS